MLPKGVHTATKTLKDGTRRVYRYAWKNGPRLHAEPGTDAFAVEYGDAIRSKRKVDGDTLRTFSILYLGSKRFASHAAGTQRYRRRFCRWIEAEMGDLTRDALEDPAVRGVFMNWRDAWVSDLDRAGKPQEPSPRAADLAIETLSVVLNHAIDHGRLSVNRATRLPRLHKTNRSDVVWLADEIKDVREAANPASRRLIDLARLTGMRRGDCITIPWTADKGRYLDWKTAKTKRDILVPILPELRALLDEWPRDGVPILSNTKGLPWTDRSSDKAWRVAKMKAGHDKRFHDLRGTFATNLILAGLDDERIARIMGWSKDRIAEIREFYVSRDAIIADVLNQLEKSAISNRSANPTNGRG